MPNNDELKTNENYNQVKFEVVEREEDETNQRQLFCQMDELNSNIGWIEVGRWLKFEEVVELGGRWSKPHVATLQLHSLFDLRNCFHTGAMLFDFLGGQDLSNIVG